MSATPRTDAFIGNGLVPSSEDEWQSFARELERELVAVRAERDLAIAALDETPYAILAKALMVSFELQCLPMQTARFAIEKYNALRARLTSAEAANAELRQALENLRDACHLADSNDELPSEIDGSLLDAARIALATQPPAILAVVRQLAEALQLWLDFNQDCGAKGGPTPTTEEALTAAAPYLKP